MGIILLSSILLFLFNVKESNSATLREEICPTDCICYPDQLTNLASWKWIENDVHPNPEDSEHEDFNPYTEHNEVYENPKSTKNSRSKEVALNTVTCILRNDSSVVLSQTFNGIQPSTNVLSLLQGAGSGNITVGKSHFERLPLLIGIEIQGYKHGDTDHPHDGVSSFRLEADALSSLQKLTYLSLENVVIQQRSVENGVQEYTTKIVTIRKVRGMNSSLDEDFGNEVANDLQSQLIFVTPKENKNDPGIVPYNVYKKKEVKENGFGMGYPRPMWPKVAVAFTNVPSLLHLRISECNMQDISWDMFYKLESLKYLLLEKNDLLFLPDFVFYATPNLATLSLAQNRILNLQTVGLAGLLYLQKLDVTNNNITHLSELSLPPFPHLEVADFRFNPIEAIFPNTFEVMNTTKSLYLGSPRVPVQIYPNSFYGLTSLLKLAITNVRIDFLERPMLKGMAQLKSLEMDGQVTKISYDAFSEVSKLEKLVLKKCGVKKISMDAFFGLTDLIELDLSYNQLTFLPPGIFDEQVSLREVWLQYNKLATLPKNLFTSTPVKMIRLEGNPWHCSCDMDSWNPSLINRVKRYHVPINNTFCQLKYDKGSMCHLQRVPTFQVKYVYEKRVSPVCETPQKFNKRSIFDVLRKELRYCHSSLTSESNAPVISKFETVFFGKTKGSNKTFTIVKTEEQILKEKEKQLFYAKAVKVKKPVGNTTYNTRIFNMVLNLTSAPNGTNMSLTASGDSSKLYNVPFKNVTLNMEEAPVKNVTLALDSVKILEGTDGSKTKPMDLEYTPRTNADQNETKIISPLSPPLSVSSEYKKHRKVKVGLPKKVKKPLKYEDDKENNERSQPISRKAWKLAKLSRMQVPEKS